MPFVTTAKPQALALALGLSSSDLPVWTEGDLSGLLAHQLQSPLVFDLAHSDEFTSGKWRQALSNSECPLDSFSQLLHHPHPPVALLDLMRRFFKESTTEGGDKPLPREVALLLYYAAIVAARLHAGQRISTLPDTELRRGLLWALAQPWLDDAPMRKLLEDGVKALPPLG